MNIDVGQIYRGTTDALEIHDGIIIHTEQHLHPLEEVDIIVVTLADGEERTLFAEDNEGEVTLHVPKLGYILLGFRQLEDHRFCLSMEPDKAEIIATYFARLRGVEGGTALLS